ncbi:involucrin repeat protein [Aspergillus candidus]|uniref:Involucrin repeat protein n=1 Tax=Aspergillus candidus TaxID=41067 RepID=A0A2I2FP76_ASPCN|nr:hypothetical protein BDW47DRAFT_806 [Aspergillus candidus]PLB42436.1 hypothetical protein BDW47DRAFT_806 [Aspergillus candidus]
MLKALMGGSRSSSDVRSTSSRSGRRRTDSKASSTTSRKSSRGDDRDRGLGDLSTYPTTGGRNKRYAASAAGESVASSYATADPGVLDEPDRVIIERRPGRWDNDDEDRPHDRDLDDVDRYRDRDSGDRDRQQSARRRDRVRSPSPDGERTRRARMDDRWEADDRASARRERQRAQPDVTLPPISTAIPTTGAGGASPSGPVAFDPHVPQQFPGQFPALHTEPYRPPNPAGEAADYYGDQGQSVADQPGIRPAAPEVLPNNQAHLMPASPAVNPPPEPSSVGGVGAAAAYYGNAADGAAPVVQPTGQPPLASPPDTLHSSHPSVQSTGAATYGVGDMDSPMFPPPSSATSFVPPMPSNHATKPSHSHGGTGAAVGMAAAAAGAGYMMGHHHHHSSSPHGSPPYPVQQAGNAPHDAFAGPSMYPPNVNPALYGAGAGTVGYAAHPSHPHHAALYHGPSFQSGGMAFHQRRRGPLDRFVDFWRDPDGVGMFEDYTESIGVCKYCFAPGSTSRDAPRKHHYEPRRHSGDRRSSHSRVEKLSRYTSSEDEGRHRKRSSRNSWIPGLLGGYGIKSLFNTKDFEDTYSLRPGRVPSSHGSEGGSVSGRKSDTSRGVYRRRSHDRLDRSSYSDVAKGRYGEPLRRSRSRSRSSSRPHRHSALRDAALGAAVGTAASAVHRSRQRSDSRSRSRSPRKSKGRKSSSSDSSFVDIGHPSRKSTGGAFGSFFTASSERRKRPTAKKPRSLFSFNNSSSSSTDADLAFGSGYAKKPPGARKKRGKKQDRDDVDAKLLGLGAAATALAASPHGRSRRPGEVLLGKESRTSRSDYASSATNDDGWEDLDSSDQSSSSVSSALAFGGHSALFSSDDSSDSGTSKWGWRWGSKKDKKGKKEKKNKKKRTGSGSSDDRFPTGAAALGVGALGTAALAAAASRRHTSHDGTGSLQHVAPVPTSDPSRYDTVRIPSSQPAFVRPGPIPLQQPQPVTPVSQAVYTSQGESIHAYTAPTTGPLPFRTPFEDYTSRNNYTSRPRDRDQPVSAYVDPGEAPGHIDRLHRRSNTFPASPTEPLEGSTISSLRRRATAKDQASVSFNLTEEQERRADRLERQNRSADLDGGVQLIDNEQEPIRPEDDRWSRWRRGEGEHNRRAWDEGDKQRQRDSRGDNSSSWMGAAAVGTIGAAAAASALSGRGSNDGSSEASSQRRHDERREKRRAERRRGSEPGSVTAAFSAAPSSARDTRYYPSSSPWSPEPEPAQKPPRRDVSPTKPKYEDYAEFFAPKEVRRRSNDSSRESQVMPTIIEVVPAKERPESPIEPDPEFLSRVPWKVPDITYTDPTPPHSVTGSVRDAASPVPRPQKVAREEASSSPERPVTFSRVSWGEHETHEYEVPSSDSDRDSVDRDRVRHRDRRERKPNEDSGKGIGEDIAFAATVAATAAAAGFDPSLVTDHPKYHTRSSPPHGRFSRATEQEDESRGRERPSRARDMAANGASGVQRDVDFRDKPESPTDVALHMPGGFEEPERQVDSRDASIDDPRSVVSAPAPGEYSERVSTNLQRRVSGDTEEGDDTGSPSVEFSSADGKKKRRKKHSKRKSDGLDDSASVASSPAKIGDDRDKRRDTKEKSPEEKSGNFFTNIFGSRVSEPVESKRPSSSTDRREVKSEIGSRTPEESRHRRQERSSRHRSSNRDEGLDDDDSAREDDMIADKENINVESYKSSRQRREERRRQRYEWDNKAEESEKV